VTTVVLLVVLGSQLAVLHRLNQLARGDEHEWTEADLAELQRPHPMWGNVPSGAQLDIRHDPVRGDVVYLRTPREAHDLDRFPTGRTLD